MPRSSGMHRDLLAALAVAATLLLSTDAFAETVATPLASTTVREYRDTIVFSQYAPAANQYRLAIRRAGATVPELLPVAPSGRPFEADIGPGPAGAQLAYQRCDGETCDLFTYNLQGGPQGERAIRNANDPEHHDVNPTLWRGRIAWARIYGEQRDRKVVVYTRSLTAPRSRPSARLPGVPLRRCGDAEPDVCGSTAGRSVDGLELWGDNLGQIVRYGCPGCAGISQTEVRLVRVSDRSATQVARQTGGLGGQTSVGPSFADGWLSWYRACLGDASACQGGKANPWRYNVRLRRWARGEGGPTRVDGFADTMAYHFRAESCSPETQGDPDADCRITKVPAPGYVAASRPGG